MSRIAFITCDRWPGLSRSDELVATHLEARGHTVVPQPWQSGVTALERVDLVVHRSQWDYHHDIAAYREWLSDLEHIGARVVNPVEMVTWNLSKSYLFDLARAGVDVPAMAELGPDDDLRPALGSLGLTRAVVKPMTGASGHLVELVDIDDAERWNIETRSQRAHGSWLVQELVPEVTTHGEISLVYTGGSFSHAIRKVPQAGEFRVNSRFAAHRDLVEPHAAVLTQAGAVIEVLPHTPTYARVDGVPLPDGRFRILELELHEPGLFFDLAPERADTFAAVLDGLL